MRLSHNGDLLEHHNIKKFLKGEMTSYWTLGVFKKTDKPSKPIKN